MAAGRLGLSIGAVLTVIGILPAAISMTAAAIADAHGCRLDEGDAHPCIIAGRDWGDTLYAMGVMFWFELVTIWLVPVGIVLLIVGLIQRSRSGSRLR